MPRKKVWAVVDASNSLSLEGVVLDRKGLDDDYEADIYDIVEATIEYDSLPMWTVMFWEGPKTIEIVPGRVDSFSTQRRLFDGRRYGSVAVSARDEISALTKALAGSTAATWREKS